MRLKPVRHPADNCVMSATPTDYYAILHVDPAAPAQVIRASFRTLMQHLRAHPDLGGDHDAAAQLNAAYAVLKDPVRRAQYDAERAGAAGKPRSGERPASKARNHTAAPTQRQPPPADGSSGQPQSENHTSTRSHDTYGSTGVWMDESSAVTCVDICLFCGVASQQRHADSSEECRVCTAPLTIVEPVSPTRAETQRLVYRIAKAEAVRIHSSPQDRAGIAARVQDISVSGIRFSCANQFDAGAIVRVDCDICTAVARIAHVSRSSTDAPQYGAEFLTVRFRRQRGSLLSVPA